MAITSAKLFTATRSLRRALAVGVVALLSVATLTPLTSPAQAASTRINLRVLVLTSGGPSEEAIATQMSREGVPYDKFPVTEPVNAALLEDAGAAKYQAIVMPSQAPAELDATEMAVLATYERTYGVRQVSAYNYPGASMGLQTPTFAGELDGAPASVTAAGRSGPFASLNGPLTIDNFAAGLEVYGYLAAPRTDLPAGESFTPLVQATVGSATGALIGSYAHDGREELVLTAAYNPAMQWFNELGHGIISWMTRGIHLGYARNYFAVHIDDVFLPDGRWSVAGKCTPGDNCVDPTITTADIRMTPADVTRLVAWQNANNFKLDMVFNGGGSEAWKLANGGTDAFATAMLAQQSQFPWINHTYNHPFLGCIQIAPTVQGETWHCATTPTEEPRQDPEIPQELSGGIYWASQAFIQAQIQDNITWATGKLTDFDPTEVVTGEHSGLRTLPQQPVDNPFLAPAFSALGIHYAASDASRETDPRAVGTATTIPRHPMNIFYNTATYQELISEYNWIYTTRANGGSGLCEDNPTTSTCITPLAAGSNAEAQQSYTSYLQPLEIRNALKYALTNDPRPFYAHQTNLAEDGNLYPVVTGVLDAYRAVYNDPSTPLVHLDMTGQSAALARMNAWAPAEASATGYLDASGIHVPGAGPAVPVTVPTGTTGATLESYAGERSGWLTSAATLTPPTNGGYTLGSVVPAAPAIGTASAGNASATVTWTAPTSTGGSPITGYTVNAYAGTSTTPAATATAAAAATSLSVTGLTNDTAYTFTVSATNAVGTGPESARSNAVTPIGPATAPGMGTAAPANTAAVVNWTPPTSTGGATITSYRVRAFSGTTTAVVRIMTAPATATSLTMTGL
ncbi:MAG: fibronectin type III domain-containing protein, partial [Frankiaceae bacterium]